MKPNESPAKTLYDAVLHDTEAEADRHSTADRTHWEGCWREHRECAIARIVELNTWKEALENEAVISWCYTEENKDDPRKMLDDIIYTSTTWALDPAISSDAEALIQRGRDESMARIAELETVIGNIRRWAEKIADAMLAIRNARPSSNDEQPQVET